MNLFRLNVWRKAILIGYVLGLFILFGFDWGYNYHIGHAVRISVGAAAFWLAVGKM